MRETTFKTYIIDGKDFNSLDQFFDVFTEIVLSGNGWGRNWDAFSDVLSGGFGTPENGFILKWKNSVISKKRLGQNDYWQIVNILQRHGPNGEESHDGIHLYLE